MSSMREFEEASKEIWDALRAEEIDQKTAEELKTEIQ